MRDLVELGIVSIAEKEARTEELSVMGRRVREVAKYITKSESEVARLRKRLAGKLSPEKRRAINRATDKRVSALAPCAKFMLPMGSR